MMNEIDLAKPEDTDQFLELLDRSQVYLDERQEVCSTKFQLGRFKKCVIHQDQGLITFSEGEIAQLQIKYVVAGSISKNTQTWLWGWANSHLPEHVSKVINQVRDYGVTQHLEKLTKRKWHAEAEDGWEMTAITAYLLHGQGAYCHPTDGAYFFLVFMHIDDFRK